MRKRSEIHWTVTLLGHFCLAQEMQENLFGLAIKIQNLLSFAVFTLTSWGLNTFLFGLDLNQIYRKNHSLKIISFFLMLRFNAVLWTSKTANIHNKIFYYLYYNQLAIVWLAVESEVKLYQKKRNDVQLYLLQPIYFFWIPLLTPCLSFISGECLDSEMAMPDM